MEIKVARRLRKHLRDLRFMALAKLLEALKNRHEQGLLVSVELLKELRQLAKGVETTEQTSPSIEREERGKATLTKLIEEVKNDDAPIVVEHK